jgi:tetratricopeptide (TPR) repeat protein
MEGKPPESSGTLARGPGAVHESASAHESSSRLSTLLLASALLVLLVFLGVLAARRLLRSDVDQTFGRYDEFKAVGNDEDAAKALGRLITAAERLYQAKRFAEATRVFEEVLRREPDQPLVLSYLGILATDRHQEDQAIRYFRRAIELDPLTPQHYWNLAHIYFNRKDYFACEEELQPALRLGLKAQYRLLYALCAIGRGLPEQIVVRRLRDVVSVAESQMLSMKPEELTPDGSLGRVLQHATRLLASHGDNFGYDRLRKLTRESQSSTVRKFARQLLSTLDEQPPGR